MQDDIRECEKCGNKCKSDDLYCEQCGTKLPQLIICPECQCNNDKENVYCINCGCKLKNIKIDTGKKEKSNTSCLWLFFLFFIIIYLGYFFIEKAPVPEEKINCESQWTKDSVLEIFKKNNVDFKEIDESSVLSYSLELPITTSYAENIGRYECSGQIVVKSKAYGFRPNEFDYTNNFYNNYSDAYPHLYRCNVQYSVQKSEGNNVVYSSYCTGTNLFDVPVNNGGVFE